MATGCPCPVPSRSRFRIRDETGSIVSYTGKESGTDEENATLQTPGLTVCLCVCFSGEELEYHLKDLRPATDYHVR